MTKKYIDTEKLKLEIEKRAKFHDDAMKACIGLNNIAITHSAGWKEDTELLTIIDSLQQEQPEVDLYNNGWIDCAKQMPKETKQWSDTMQGHREWTESDRVLVWDSMYGYGVDATKNGKWISEQRNGYTGQVVHGIIAWRPIPEFNEELLFNTRKKK